MKTFVIKKGHRYWKYDSLGYSTNIDDAKLFTEEEALEIVQRPYSDKTMHEV